MEDSKRHIFFMKYFRMLYSKAPFSHSSSTTYPLPSNKRFMRQILCLFLCHGWNRQWYSLHSSYIFAYLCVCIRYHCQIVLELKQNEGITKIHFKQKYKDFVHSSVHLWSNFFELPQSWNSTIYSLKFLDNRILAFPRLVEIQ